MKGRWIVGAIIGIAVVAVIVLLGISPLGNRAAQPALYSLNGAPSSGFYAETTAEPPIAGGESAESRVADNVSTQPQQPAQDIERVILRNATLTITVDDPAAKIAEIAQLAESMGGWVVTSGTISGTDRVGAIITSGNITVRVPSARLDEALTSIKAGTLNVDSESVTGQDVTTEYVDLTSRLGNLQATEQQLQRIMETAMTVEDVLAVQRELTTVRGEIEVIQGRLNYFDEAAAFSSIGVTVRPRVPDAVTVQAAGWSPGNTAEGALGLLLGILQFAANAVITLLIIGLPLAVIVGLPAYVIWRVWRRRAARREPMMMPAGEAEG